MHPPLETRPVTQWCVLTGNRGSEPPLSHISQGICTIVLVYSLAYLFLPFLPPFGVIQNIIANTSVKKIIFPKEFCIFMCYVWEFTAFWVNFCEWYKVEGLVYVQFFHHYLFYFNYFIDFYRERVGESGEREAETSVCDSCMCPDQGLNLKPWHIAMML